MFKIIKNWLKRINTAKQIKLIIKKKQELQKDKSRRKLGLTAIREPSPMVTFGRGIAASLNLDEIAKIFSSFLFRPIDISKISKDDHYLCFWYGAYFIEFDCRDRYFISSFNRKKGILKYTYGYSFDSSKETSPISEDRFTSLLRYASAVAFYKGTKIYFTALYNDSNEKFEWNKEFYKYPCPVTLQTVLDDLKYIQRHP